MFKKKPDAPLRQAEDAAPPPSEEDMETSSLIANLKQVAPPIKSGTARTAGSVISAELTITGNLVSKGLVEIFGKIDGNIRCATLVIGESAMVTGDLEAKNLMVNGRVTGTLRGTDVDLGPSAHVDGDIHHQTLAIAQGAHFEGRAQRSDAPKRVEQQSSSQQRAPQEQQKPAASHQQPMGQQPLPQQNAEMTAPSTPPQPQQEADASMHPQSSSPRMVTS